LPEKSVHTSSGADLSTDLDLFLWLLSHKYWSVQFWY